MLDAMARDFERATGPWHLEWAAVPERFALSSGPLAQASLMLSGLEVNPDRMRDNLTASRGLIVAEAVMMALAPMAGRQAAHDLVCRACREAADTGKPVFDILAKDQDVATLLRLERLRELTEPANHLGGAGYMVDRILGGSECAPLQEQARTNRTSASLSRPDVHQEPLRDVTRNCIATTGQARNLVNARR